MKAIFDSLRGIVVGIILIAVGWVMISAESGIPLLVDVGWIFLIGGLIVAGLSIFTSIREN